MLQSKWSESATPTSVGTDKDGSASMGKFLKALDMGAKEALQLGSRQHSVFAAPSKSVAPRDSVAKELRVHLPVAPLRVCG